MACRGFLQCLLKLFNLALALVGVLLLVFSVSLLVKEKSLKPPPPLSPPISPTSPPPSSPPESSLLHESLLRLGPRKAGPGFLEEPLHHVAVFHLQPPQLPQLWFTYLLIGVGAYVTVLTLIGAIAAESNFSCCLSTYQFGLCFLLLFQLIAGSLVWLEEVPVDPTGEFDKHKKFVQDNMELCKLAAICLLLAEGTALLLAMMLRAIQVDEAAAADDEDDYVLVPRSQQRRASHTQPLLAPPQSTIPTPGGVGGGAATTSLAPTSSSGTSAAGASGPAWSNTGTTTPHSDAWRAHMMEKYDLDPTEYGGGENWTASALSRNANSVASQSGASQGQAQEAQEQTSGQKCSVM